MPVLVDLWGPKCSPRPGLMNDVTAMAIAFRVVSVTTSFFNNGGALPEPIGGSEMTLESIRENADGLLSRRFDRMVPER